MFKLTLLASIPTAYFFVPSNRQIAIAGLKTARFIGLTVATLGTAAFALWLHCCLICISVIHANCKNAGISPLISGPTPKAPKLLPASDWMRHHDAPAGPATPPAPVAAAPKNRKFRNKAALASVLSEGSKRYAVRGAAPEATQDEPCMAWLKKDLLAHATGLGLAIAPRATKAQILKAIKDAVATKEVAMA